MKLLILSSKGFTLVELLVVFSVLSILAVSSLVSFTSYSRSQAVNNEKNALITTLNVARSRAQSQVKPASCAGQTLSGYMVSINTSSETYTLRAFCSSSIQPISTTTLPSGVEVFSASPADYFFPILTGAATNGTIVISGYGINQTITVNSNGTIN